PYTQPSASLAARHNMNCPSGVCPAAAVVTPETADSHCHSGASSHGGDTSGSPLTAWRARLASWATRATCSLLYVICSSFSVMVLRAVPVLRWGRGSRGLRRLQDH